MTQSLAFRLPIAILKERNRFVAYTPALDLSTSGKTAKEAQDRFAEAATLFLEEIFENNTADEVLYDLGWSKVRKSWKPPLMISHKTEAFQVTI